MKTSFDEMAILAVAGQSGKRSKDSLAKQVALAFSSPRVDQMTLTRTIESLQASGYLRTDKDRNIELTREGWATVLEMLPSLESLRAIAGTARFDIARRIGS